MRNGLSDTRPRIRTRRRCRWFPAAVFVFQFGGFALADAGGGEIVFLVDGVDGALEAAEESFGAEEGGGEVDGVGEFVNYVTLVYRYTIW